MGLLLARRLNESILIGEEIEVTLQHFDGKEALLYVHASEKYGGNRQWRGKLSDTLKITKDISITIAPGTMDTKQLELHGAAQVKLMIDAPRSVEVWRKELRK